MRNRAKDKIERWNDMGWSDERIYNYITSMNGRIGELNEAIVEVLEERGVNA